MRRIVGTLITAGTLIQPVCSWAGELKPLRFNTVVFLCDGALQTGSIPNPTGQTIFVRRAFLWHGLYSMQLASVVSEITRSTDGMLILNFLQHRWAEPDGTTQVESDFGSDYVSIPAGASMTVRYFCGPVSGGTYYAAVHGIVWYTTDSAP